MPQVAANVTTDQRDVDRGLTADEFGDQFQGSFRVLWLVAVGIVQDRTQAEDVVQEAALIALGKLGQYQVGTNFTAWMSQIVRFVALNVYRKDAKHRAASLDPVTLDQAGEAPRRAPVPTAPDDDATVDAGTAAAPMGTYLTADGQLPAGFTAAASTRQSSLVIVRTTLVSFARKCPSSQ